MGANSVTGIGQGSAEGPFRSTTTLGTYRKITGINSTQIADGSIINEEFQRLSGVTGSLQQQINEIASYVAPQNIIPVSPNAAIKSIAEACDSIIDSSEDNRYIIQVNPGAYVEPLIEVPDFVYIVGANIDAVVVEPDASDHHVFSLGNRSGIANLSITNAGSGYAGIYSYDVGDFSLIHKVSIFDCSIGVLHLSNIEDSYLFLEYVDFTDCTTNSIKVLNSGVKECELFFENIYVEHAVSNPTNNISIDGNCTLRGTVGHFLGANTVGNGILITNGGRAILNSLRFRGYNRGVYADTNGNSPRIELSDVSFGASDGTPNNIDVEIANTTAFGNFTGYAAYEKTIINASNNFFVANKDRNTIVVAKKGGDFNSVKDAVDSIGDSSTTNRYVVYVGPGNFTEDTIELKDFVSIYANILKGTSIVLKENPTENILIKTNAYSTITNVLLSGNGVGSTILKYSGNELRLDGCRFTKADVAIDATEVNGSKVNYPNKLAILESCLARPGNVETIFKFSDDGTQPLEVVVSGFIDIDSLIKATNIAEIGIVTGGARGTNTKVAFKGCNFPGGGSGTAIKIGDGADVDITGCNIYSFETAIKVENLGDGPTIECISTLLHHNTNDVIIEHPSANGSIFVSGAKDKITIDENANISVLIQDETSGSVVMSGDFYRGDNYSDITNMTEFMSKGATCGVTSGGGITLSSGRLINVAAGSGYVYVDDHIKYVTWTAATDLEITANTNTSIYVDENGTVNTLSGTGTVNFFTQIFLGRVVTTATDVVFIVDTYRDAVTASTKYDRLLRLYLGPIFRSGCITSSSNLNLNVTSGDWIQSVNRFQPSGGTPVTFSTWYRNGSSWFIITDGQTNVPNGHYDDGTGTLHALTDGHYTKHALYTYGQDLTEKYFLVYGQEEFDSEENAIAGALPITPGPLSAGAVCIASIVVLKGAPVIADVLDQRPALTSQAGAITSTSVHGNLEGLGEDDHTQYLLGDGTRAMSGALNMGTFQITNVGNVDGVDVSAHQTRHIPGGTDELPVDAPNANLSAISTNQAGVQPKFARSDHWHAITAYSNGTVGGLVKLDASGDFTANEITADLIGTATNVTGIVAVANGGTNSATALNNNRVVISSGNAIVENAAITASRALASNANGLPVASSVTSTELSYVSGASSNIQNQINAISQVTTETGTNATYSLTTTAGQRVIVQVKASLLHAGNGLHTVTLAYNGVTKDTALLRNSNNYYSSVMLQYTEIPGAATANITLTTDSGTLGNIVYIIQKIG